MINLNLNNLLVETKESIENQYSDKIDKIKEMMINKTGAGSDFLGWIDWPSQDFMNKELIKIKNIYAEWTYMNINTIVVIGIGGSYIGAKTGIEMCTKPFNKNINIIFASGLHSVYNQSLLELLKTKNWGIIVVSKSGTTFETAVNFRIFREALFAHYSYDCHERIIAVTDAQKGVLKTLCDKNGYKTFSIPDDIGGRYSTITPIGLLPMVFAGMNIDKIIDGWKTMLTEFKQKPASENSAMIYAATRHILNTKHNKRIEIFCTYENNMKYIAEHYKQIFAESEGKNHGCILPTIANNSEDLHSIGQLYQQGINNAFETSINLLDISNSPTLSPSSFLDDDSLNYIAGKKLIDLNKSIQTAVVNAHTKQANIPNISIDVDELSDFNFGYICAWMAIAAATSAYLFNVNPFDQPGVEAYKAEMKKLIK